jgi:asparagine synthase (glutamine-hydrolysing)
VGGDGFSHEPRWSTTSALQRFFSDGMHKALAASPAPDPLRSLPAGFRRWGSLARAQYLEIRTLLSPYLLSSQGDRMLMAHSVEGRFPFLDVNVMTAANMLPPHFKLAGLEEKQILKRAAKGLVPPEIVRRKKQPYRAPDAASFITAGAPAYVEEMFDERTVRDDGIFSPEAVRGLFGKCMAKREHASASGLFSNSDNMAFVGILSTQLLVRSFIANPIPRTPAVTFVVHVDRLAANHHSLEMS